MARFLNDRAHPALLPQPVPHEPPVLPHLGAPGRALYRGIRGGLHGFLARFTNNEALYSNLDIKYIGPVHGHDLHALEETLQAGEELRRARSSCTRSPRRATATSRPCRRRRPVPRGRPDRSRRPVSRSSWPAAPSWTSVFADEIVALADRNPRLVGITAAMLRPTGLHSSRRSIRSASSTSESPSSTRSTSAAGLAFGGLHPVVALYATFVNRAFDQVLMDVALHRRASPSCSTGPA